MTGGCTHPARGYAEPRLGQHDVVRKAGLAPPQIGAATDAELRLARRDVVRKESMAGAAESWDPWSARRHLDGGGRMGSMAAGGGEQARDPWRLAVRSRHWIHGGREKGTVERLARRRRPRRPSGREWTRGRLGRRRRPWRPSGREWTRAAGSVASGLAREDRIVGGSIWFISGSWGARYGLFPSSSMSNFCSLAWGFFPVLFHTVFQFFYAGVGGENVPGRRRTPIDN
jgi:hypothetical protein